MLGQSIIEPQYFYAGATWPLLTLLPTMGLPCSLPASLVFQEGTAEMLPAIGFYPHFLFVSAPYKV